MTKLPHYVLPLYPAVAILVARAIDGGRLAAGPWLVRATAWWLAFPLLVMAGGGAAALALHARPPPAAWAFAAAAVVAGFFARRALVSVGAEPALARAIAASILLGAATHASDTQSVLEASRSRLSTSSSRARRPPASSGAAGARGRGRRRSGTRSRASSSSSGRRRG